MKKLLALVLSLSLALALLAGCGQQTAQTESAEEASASEEAGETADTGDLQTIVFSEPIRGYHWAPAYLAQTLGYFEEEGLTAEFQTITGGAPHAAIFSGDADFTLAGIEMALTAAEAGQGCKILLSTTQKYPYQLIGANESYSDMESLRGGVIAGGQGATSAPQAFARACLQASGMTADTDASVITMASPAYAAAIASGEIQAAISTNPWSAKMLVDNGGVVIVDGTDDAVIEKMIGSASYELFAVIAADATIEKDPEMVQKAVNAMYKAMKWMETATPEEIAAQLLPLFEGAEEELLYDAQYDKDRGVANYTGLHTETGYAAGLAMSKLSGAITQDFPVDQIYDESFVESAALDAE